MKKNRLKIKRNKLKLTTLGFTLIELLAVIVILAIIALIAVPIILKIIDSSKDSANQRSVELYGSAVENAVGRYQMKHPEEKEITITKLEEEKLIEYKGNEVICDTTEINSDGTVYLAGCKVDNKDVSYTYGKEQTETALSYKPQYYSDRFDIRGIFLGESITDIQLTPPERNLAYLGLDMNEDKVSAGYLCFIINETEYCLKAANPEAYNRNIEILKEAFSDASCYFEFDTIYSCSDKSPVRAKVAPEGYVFVYSYGFECNVELEGEDGQEVTEFYCYSN